MKPKIELLAPGGDVDAIKAAIIAGADAVYCGLDTFNARNRAANISFDQLVGIIRLAHQYDCRIFLTLNIVILEQEFKTLLKLLNRLVNTTLDGVIVQDMGLLYVLRKHFPTLDIHASTQLTTHNAGQIPFLRKLGATRVNLSRELNLREITSLAQVSKEHDTLLEVFVHGSLCVAFSGLCYSTSASAGNSGNRGRCSQACREEYETTESGNNFPLNIKDNSAFFDLPALIDAGVYSFKVEGRIKGASYVHTVIDSFRKQIDGYVETGELTQDGERLYKVFNRDFTNAFLRGDLNQSMFIDNPRDNSKNHLVDQLKADKGESISVVQIHDAQQQLQVDKQQINASVDDKIAHLSIEKLNLNLSFASEPNKPLTLTVTTEHNSSDLADAETKTVVFSSSSLMMPSEKLSVDKEAIEKRFKNINNANYELVQLQTDKLTDGLSIPYREITTLKNELLAYLNDGIAVIAEVELPKLARHPKDAEQKPALSMLICDEEDAKLAEVTDGDIYFKLPDAYKRGCTKYVDFLQQNPRLIPWFPPVLIGKDYDVALNILQQVKPELIVTNNTGIAYHAQQLGIKWIAGPFLNTTNSYALLAMQEGFDCAGAFISNEINKQQIKQIARPNNFKMLYSIYHPILLMASRQCFFQQSVGCEKPRIDNGCMLSCDKSTSIKNLKGDSFAIDKQKAGYPSIYNQDQFLNTEIIDDLSHMFDGFMIDLTNIGAGDKESPDKVELIKQFEALLDGQNEVSTTLATMVPESTHLQYKNGL
ncbi:peptidase U32 family protein [Shewanella sp. 1_MG-2023]|uniref:peptidase U32 family protein n=1 Tax=unclassified Shewanella TaxID=196818 RepID=UPI0026E2D3BF|nr:MULTISPECIES: peptidase U32 family protein [unclassified Shewanella]MDO6612429.1 peptidase U32 family protein [Shewanella sp. 7_MG-2023]MDO6772530.1 peptidase U32 family protein [Shewanella sp. 2_MG-2023]MDO6794473.1 peptidase U32 family protein [Shewanella sp. 1_MG-2023]